MKIAVYSRKNGVNDVDFLHHALWFMKIKGVQLVIHQNLNAENKLSVIIDGCESFETYQDLKEQSPIDFCFSFGGDGSFIDAANIIADLGIPIVGINTGRIGFLTSITKNSFEQYFNMIKKGDFSVEERTLLHLSADKPLPLSNFFAVNDVTIRPSDDTSVNGILVWINGAKVNTYWADGLIVATPTGSTAYSLSCGGPILHPSTEVNIITPISSHTLAVRPIIINNEDIISINVQSRCNRFVLALDSTRIEIENPCELTISKEKFTIKTLRFKAGEYYSTIREKLMWGIDLRNFTE
jgi:NAD+ kinase